MGMKRYYWKTIGELIKLKEVFIVSRVKTVGFGLIHKV